MKSYIILNRAVNPVLPELKNHSIANLGNPSDVVITEDTNGDINENNDDSSK